MTLSFEGAEGYGADATGGRGGQVIIVTSSADSGEGTLRWAIEEFSGARTIVFEVNDIFLTSDISLTDGDITIAGQTAGGVQVRGGTIKIQDSNVIMRGMMFRPGDSLEGQDPESRDALKISGGSGSIQDIIIDHNSFEWGIDENVEIWKDVSSLTFSNNIVAEGLANSLHPEGEHSMGLLIASGGSGTAPQEISIVDNLFAFNHHRNPRIADGNTIEFVNNYIYGSGQQSRTMQISDIRGQSAEYINVINNYFEAGPETEGTDEPGIKVDTKYNFVNGNIHFDRDGNQLTKEFHGDGSAFMRTAADFGSGLDIMEVINVKGSVLSNVGANPYDRDAVDQRIIDLVVSGQGGLVDSVAEAGGYANTPYTAPLDTDDDGMPDWFEDQYGFDKTRFDSNGDSDGDGYTNIEEYINGLYTGFNLNGTSDGTTLPPVLDPAPVPDPAPTTDPAPTPSGGLTLIDTVSDQAVATLKPSGALSETYIGNERLTISYQATVADVGSVKLDFNGGEWIRTENSSPYALFGDDGSGDFFATNIGALFPTNGEYSIDVTLYSGGNGSGSVLGTENVSFLVGDPSEPVPEDPSSLPEAPSSSSFEKHINVGGRIFVASDGTVFEADPGIDSGSYILRNRSHDVSGTEDDKLYQTYGFGDFSYAVEVPEDGTYEVTLYFTEPWARSEGKRIFDVTLEGGGGFHDIDLYALSGGKWDTLTLTETVEVNDGVLDIDVTPLINNGILSGISVLEMI